LQNQSIREANWYLYESAEVQRSDEVRELFFVGIGYEIVSDRFLFLAPVPAGRLELLELGIWRDVQPLLPAPSPSSSSLAAIGRTRAMYRTFYDDTPVGRAFVMTPGAERLDGLEHWVQEVPKAPGLATQLETSLKDLNQQVAQVNRTLKAMLWLSAILLVGVAMLLLRG
jgi:hypothetical protein